LGIAAYLLLIWKQEGSKQPIRFVDLGCGNGLLVYILFKEGHIGTGHDLRARKIWSFFQSEGAVLEVSTVTPSPDNLDQFTNFDWIIGNHSDELTPWMPVLARRSNAKLFLLPCCPFEFYGKLRRSKSGSKSHYRELLDYVQVVGEKCGFLMEEDRLRIPSTKRVCFIARKDSKQFNSEQVDANISEMTTKPVDAENCDGFVARSTVEKVRNGTQVPKTVLNQILKWVSQTLLETSPPPVTPSANSRVVGPEQIEVKNWNPGGRVFLGDLAKGMPNDLAEKLKGECSGGLQTILRNHNFVFIVEPGGFVRLRNPMTDDLSAGKRKRKNTSADVSAAGTRQRRKTKLCWLHENHPQKCPVKAESCHWAHGSADLCEQ